MASLSGARKDGAGDGAEEEVEGDAGGAQHHTHDPLVCGKPLAAEGRVDPWRFDQRHLPSRTISVPPSLPRQAAGVTWAMKVPMTMQRKSEFLKMPSKTLISLWILRLLISLKSCAGHRQHPGRCVSNRSVE